MKAGTRRSPRFVARRASRDIVNNNSTTNNKKIDIDIEHWPNCGGALKTITAIEDPPVIVRILAHLGLPTRVPPRSPAQRLEWLALGQLVQAA